MDPNLLFWKNEGKSFGSRLRIWLDLLDPFLLLSSDAEIKKARALLKDQHKEKDGHALNLSLSSVHADSGNVLPIIYRPPAFVPLVAPLVLSSLLPHRSVSTALLCQTLLQSYSVGFNHANRNSSSEKDKRASQKLVLLMAGTISYTACAGAIPQILINRLGIRSDSIKALFRTVMPIPLSAALAFLNVVTVRSQEPETGIQVFDTFGNPVGFSKAAGQKAVTDTAKSRSLLVGSTAALPPLLVLLLKRTRLLQRNPWLVNPVHYVSSVLVLGLMVPVTFSLFPQLGKIREEDIEEDLKGAAVYGHLYYHRGL